MKKNPTIVVVAFLSQSAHAFDGSFFSERPSKNATQIETLFEHVMGETTWNEQQIKITHKLTQTPKNAWSVFSKANHLSLSPEPLIPSRNARIPSDLWDLSLGTRHSEETQSGSAWGGQTSIGSPSNSPFSSLEETTYDLSAFYRLPEVNSKAWWFFIHFSTHRNFLPWVPLPGVGYSILSEDKTLWALFGLPFLMLSWNPNKVWRLQTTFVFTNLKAELSYMPSPPFRFYSQASWIQRSYLRTKRPGSLDRLFLTDMRGALGVSSPVAEGMSADLSLGYSFERKYFESRSFFNQDNGVGFLESGLILQLQLKASL